MTDETTLYLHKSWGSSGLNNILLTSARVLQYNSAAPAAGAGANLNFCTPTNTLHPVTQRDTLFADPLGRVARFSFDERVANVFADMVQRSIPGYQTVINLTGQLAGRFAESHSHLYDLGCSLGAGTLSMRQHIEGRSCQLFAIDNSKAMLQRCAENIAKDTGFSTPVRLCEARIEETPIENASVVALNYTLQFIEQSSRDALLSRIAANTRPGGVLLLSEKICFNDARQQALHTQMYHDFKRANGYSDLEISQKRSALEEVLVPETLDCHKQRLLNAGYSSVEVWFQCFNFASILALK